MRFPLALLVPFLVVVSGVAFADRTDVYLSNSAIVTRVHLDRLADGGCAVDACGQYSKQDGGTTRACTPSIDVAGANRTTCLDLLDNKAPALFKSNEGL